MGERYLIWSNEHGRWWRSGWRGYTSVIAEAGRYVYCEADLICRQANIHLPEGHEPNEVVVLAPEYIKSEDV